MSHNFSGVSVTAMNIKHLWDSSLLWVPGNKKKFAILKNISLVAHVYLVILKVLTES